MPATISSFSKFSLLQTIISALKALRQDFEELTFRGARANQASSTALAVAISVGIACAMHLQDVWWAAISGLMCTQPTRPASIQKALLRIAGTMGGALLGLALIDWLAYDQLACCLALFVMSAFGIIGVNVSPHGYAWLFLSITFCLVVLPSLVDPFNAFNLAVNRTLEVVVGSSVAVVIAIALAPKGEGSAAPMPGWNNLLGAQWPIVQHALRSGFTVALIPVLWSFFNLPSIAPAVITMVAVLAVPVLSNDPRDHQSRIAEKAIHRLLGCLAGGSTGLLLLTAPLTNFAPWLIALGSGTWLFAYIQGSWRGIGYIGTQAAVVFLMTLVQAEGPPESILPAINRLAGIVIGMTTLFTINFVLAPGTSSEGFARQKD